MKSLPILLALLVVAMRASAQDLTLPANAAMEDGSLAQAMPALARAALEQYQNPDRDTYLQNRYRLQLAAGDLAGALTSFNAWRDQHTYGTGKDVSDESIADAKVPLHIDWQNDSTVSVPVWQ